MSLSFNIKIGEKTVGLEVEGEGKTIAQAKAQLAEQSGIFGGRWIYKGRVLQDTHIVAECGIDPGTVVIVMGGTTQSPNTQERDVASQAPSQTPTDSNNTALPDSNQIAAVLSAMARTVPVTANRTGAMDSAMGMLLENRPEVVSMAVETALKITTNIVSHPLEEKYRRLPATNANLNNKLLGVAGGKDLLSALGFNLTTDGSAWQLEPSAERWETLNACHKKLSVFCKKLSETPTASPNPVPPAAVAPTIATLPSTPGAVSGSEQLGQEDLVRLIASLAAASFAGNSSSGGSGGGESNNS